MSTKWFDPRDLLFKSPFGAVPRGADVSFCFRPERGAAVTRCELLAHGEFADQWTTVELTPAQEDGHVVYRGIFTAPDDVELVWYHFRLSWADGGTSCYGKNGLCAWDAVEPWQLTVYDDTHKTPAWFGRGVTYQIFPDRFRCAKSRDVAGLVGPRTLHENWDELPEYRPNAEGEITCSDFFGGDLQGITEKLDYLVSLGVTTLYLCPIFEASTNHRYDTACYERIDPLLGDEADFRTLCAEAKKRGIYVMLDGVFNHTGRKSVYFNADGFYDDLGAAQGEQSPYYRWYNFHPFPDEYDAWWGIKNLPAVNERNESYVNYIITGENSIVRRWLRAGASAWRLDVADELPDEFIFAIRAVMQQDFPDAYLLGEVWEDGTTKVAYSKRRRYLLGGGLHGLMNYPFRTALLPYLDGTSGAEEYGTPVRMAKAISAELSVEVAEAILYADDGADEVVKEFVSGKITLNVNDLLPADLAALLGQKQDTDKVVYGSDSDEAPYTAIGFRAKKAGGTYKYIWLYKVKFAIPDENYTTKGDSIEFTTPEIVGQFIKRSDGLWKAEHVAEPTNSVATAWFTSVREPNNAGS